MKPPPSNRFWFGFHPPGPRFDFDVAPTVAGYVLDNQWAVIRDFMKVQAMNGLQDAVVVPNGLDIALGPGLFDEQSVRLFHDDDYSDSDYTLIDLEEETEDEDKNHVPVVGGGCTGLTNCGVCIDLFNCRIS
jgi:hypothetical protein